MGTANPLVSGKSSLPLDTSKVDPQVLYQLQQQAAVNKYLGVKGAQQTFLSTVTIAKSGTLSSTLASTQIKPSPQPDQTAVYAHPNIMKYNLPPHSWSLPLSPGSLDSTITRDNNGVDASSNRPTLSQIQHNTRRAIMYQYDDSGTSTAPGTGITTTPTSGADPTIVGSPNNATDNYWGFQFLWNPTSISTVLARNANVVPSNLDKFSASSGLFTAMETLQFTITIDRINDFASFRALLNTTYPGAPSFTDIAKTYYTTGYPTTAVQDPASQVQDLLRKGTMADVEYILRMLNGSGKNGQVWVNALNRKTADLGFLQPTAVAIQFGPNPDSLSYIGWIESMQITHSVFTEDMIPIHTDINVSFNAFSRVALVNAGK